MPLTFNGSTPENVNWNGNALSKVTYNGGVVWEKVTNTLLESCYWYNSSGKEEGLNNEWEPPQYASDTYKSYYAAALHIDQSQIKNSNAMQLYVRNNHATVNVTVTVYTFKMEQTTLDGIYRTNFTSLIGDNAYIDKYDITIEANFIGYKNIPITSSKYQQSGNYFVYMKSNIVGYGRWWATYGLPNGDYQPKFATV